MRGINEALAGLPPAEAGGSTVLLRVCQVLVPLRTPVRGLDGFRIHGRWRPWISGLDVTSSRSSRPHALLSFQRPGTSSAGGVSAREGTKEYSTARSARLRASKPHESALS